MHPDFRVDIDDQIVPDDLFVKYLEPQGRHPLQSTFEPQVRINATIHIRELANFCSSLNEDDTASLIRSLGENISCLMTLEKLAYLFGFRVEHMRKMREIGHDNWIKNRLEKVRSKTEEYDDESAIIIADILEGIRKLKTLTKAHEILETLSKETRAILQD